MVRRAPARPVATLTLLAVVFGFYGVELAGDGSAICERWGLVPTHPTVAGLVASMALHDPSGWGHVLGNALALLVAGVAVERVLGHWRVLALFLVAGVAGALAHVAADPSSTSALVGCSASVFGLLGAMALLYPRTVGFVATLTAVNVWQTFAGTGGSVAVAAHCAGFAAGAVVTVLVFGQRLAVARGWRRVPA